MIFNGTLTHRRERFKGSKQQRRIEGRKAVLQKKPLGRGDVRFRLKLS